MKKTFRLNYSIVQDGFLDFASQAQMKEALTQLEEGNSSIDDASNSAHWMSKAVIYHKRYDGIKEFETSVITETNYEPLKEYS